MTVQEIIIEYQNNGYIKNVCKKFNVLYLDDIIQEIFCIIAEYKCQECIIEMYKNNELNKFIYKIIKNNVYSGPYFRMYTKYDLRHITIDEEHKY